MINHKKRSRHRCCSATTLTVPAPALATASPAATSVAGSRSTRTRRSTTIMDHRIIFLVTAFLICGGCFESSRHSCHGLLQSVTTSKFHRLHRGVDGRSLQPSLLQHQQQQRTAFTTRTKKQQTITSTSLWYSDESSKDSSSDSTTAAAASMAAKQERQALLEMGSMTAVGFLLAGSVLLNLAIDDVTIDVSSSLISGGGIGGSGGALPGLVGAGDDSGALLELAANNILDAALPTSATDVIAVSLGEIFGGLVGAYATTLVTFFVSLRMKMLGMDTTNNKTGYSYLSKMINTTPNSFWLDALANTDYFLTRAAAVPILLACGCDPLVSSLGGVVIATIPYELIKYQGRFQAFRATENELLQELLEEEQQQAQQAQQQQKSKSKLKGMTSSSAVLTSPQASSSSSSSSSSYSYSESFQPVLLVEPPRLDLAEFITDLILWLEYDVLKGQYSGSLVMMGFSVTDMGVESAIFGFLAALSSQLYLDAMYQWTNLGPAQETMAARNRNVLDLLTVYSTRCLKTAALFGVYETVKEPVRTGMAQLLSGGAVACYGSSNYDLCVESYIASSSTTNNEIFTSRIDGDDGALILDMINLQGLTDLVDTLIGGWDNIVHQFDPSPLMTSNGLF